MIKAIERLDDYSPQMRGRIIEANVVRVDDVRNTVTVFVDGVDITIGVKDASVFKLDHTLIYNLVIQAMEAQGLPVASVG